MEENTVASLLAEVNRLETEVKSLNWELTWRNRMYDNLFAANQALCKELGEVKAKLHIFEDQEVAAMQEKYRPPEYDDLPF